MRLIDATVFRRELDKHYPFTEEPQKMHGMADIAKGGAMRALACTPTVDAVPVVHGRWIDLWDGYRCSACNLENNYEDNFCPNCGAKMDGKDGERNDTK